MLEEASHGTATVMLHAEVVLMASLRTQLCVLGALIALHVDVAGALLAWRQLLAHAIPPQLLVPAGGELVVGPRELFFRGAIYQLLFQLAALDVMLVYPVGRRAFCSLDCADVWELDVGASRNCLCSILPGGARRQLAVGSSS